MYTNAHGATAGTSDIDEASAEHTPGIVINEGIPESYTNSFGETTLFVPRMIPLRRRRSCILTDKYKLIGLTMTSIEERLFFVRQYFTFATISGFASAMGYSRHTIAHFFKEEGDRRSIVIPPLSRGSNTIIMDLEITPQLIEMNLERNKRSCSLEDRKKLYFEGKAIADKYRAESYELRKLLSWALEDRSFVLPAQWARREKAMLEKYNPEYIQHGLFKLVKIGEVARLTGDSRGGRIQIGNRRFIGILDMDGGSNYKKVLDNLPPVVAPLFPANLLERSLS